MPKQNDVSRHIFLTSHPSSLASAKAEAAVAPTDTISACIITISASTAAAPAIATPTSAAKGAIALVDQNLPLRLIPLCLEC